MPQRKKASVRPPSAEDPPVPEAPSEAVPIPPSEVPDGIRVLDFPQARLVPAGEEAAERAEQFKDRARRAMTGVLGFDPGEIKDVGSLLEMMFIALEKEEAKAMSKEVERERRRLLDNYKLDSLNYNVLYLAYLSHPDAFPNGPPKPPEPPAL